MKMTIGKLRKELQYLIGCRANVLMSSGDEYTRQRAHNEIAQLEEVIRIIDGERKCYAPKGGK